ncbi:cation:proton antiporter [Thermococcus sp. GR7]|uniref:cation:proton antiporter n=1 Tax=unclassified Thermococcus TaxID=2627626 RepID=UPI0014301CE2|nr:MULTISPECIES: cation:proton antiporter [unclassified Thermococcus]NJE46057.1 cation:proton antiporter [Thermococcus sp. GR7]NJE78307.1 cation:proton antiporter [Thermococcus sp. GR4]NJF22254.1 cation:proton antiporter [Thermococcus sp. GR5]
MDVFLELAVILITAKLAGYISSRLGLPAALGQIVGGILLGPSLLNFVTYDEGIRLIADLGVVMLLFLAGLETDIEEFKRVGLPAFLIAVLGVAIPFLLGYAIAFKWGYPQMQALFLGGVMTATSVSLTVNVLMELKKLRTRVGTTILAAAVVDDVLGIIILTILVAINTKGTVYAKDIEIILMEIAAFFVLSYLFGKRAIKKLLKTSHRINLPETVTTVALVVMLFFAYLAEYFQIAAITGAYLAGILVAGSGDARKITDKIITIGYAFFIPIFLVGVGAETNAKVIFTAGTFAFVYSLLAVIGKVLGCGVGALLSKFKPEEALQIGIGMIPRMEVGLIMANIGLVEGVLDRAAFSMAIAMVMATTLVTPPLLKWAFTRD